MEQRLAEYKRKRSFGRTPEPSGEKCDRSGQRPLFVVQKHDASTLHYDLRLEIGGVLVSWAVPKGPSTDPRERRLAMRTEDHPLEYADFEGVIPEGEYGAGAVIVWDTGTYRIMEGKDGRDLTPQQALRDGHITVWLEGKKLKGGYALTQMGKGKRWLLVKMRDEKADARRNPVTREPGSVLSGRHIEEVEQEGREAAGKAGREDGA
ncbi:MAG: DNA polymerase ligase N-terminal domain-containing protein [Dehalococcoidia bacterium]